MELLLNISTHPGDLEIIDNNWARAEELLAETGFDGFELYPVGDYPWETIPRGLVAGLHLRYYPILSPLWHEDYNRLMKIFGDMETVRHFYGGADRHALVAGYRRQFDLATYLHCKYVVFHIAQSELEYIHDWMFPWTFQETADLCTELLREVLGGTSYEGELLLENLWWPGSFRGDRPEEITYLLGNTPYPRTGVMFDTGHLLNTYQSIRTEKEGIKWIDGWLRGLGILKSTIRGVHLTRSLSAEYVIRTRNNGSASEKGTAFWDRYREATKHVRQIDQHEAFEDPEVENLFNLINPGYVVFEFTYSNMDQWMRKIRRQQKAVAGLFSCSNRATREA